MNDLPLAIFTLAGSVVVYAVLWFFKSPKEVNGELSGELRALRHETKLNSELSARHDERIATLIVSLDRLTARLERLELPKPAPHRRGG